MKQTIILILILISFCGQIFAAKTISNTTYEVMYEEGVNTRVNCIIFDRYTAWIGTNLGLMGSTLDYPNIMSILSSENADLPGDMVTAVAIKNSDELWVGTDNGLALLDPFNWVSTIPKLTPFKGAFIRSLTVDNDGLLWIGADNSNNEYEMMAGMGLISYDGSQWKHYGTDIPDEMDNSIGSIVVDSRNRKWLGTVYEPFMQDRGNGLCSFDGTKLVVHGNGEGGSYVDCMALDADGNLWMGLSTRAEGGMYGSGLARFDGKTWTFYNTENSEIPGNYVSSLVIGKDGAIWMAVSDTDDLYPVPVGLARFDGQQWQMIKHNQFAGPEERITALGIDPMGKVWVGKSSGLAVINFNP